MKMKKEEGGPRVGLGNRLFVFVPGEEFLLIHLGTCKHDAESNQIKIGPALSQGILIFCPEIKLFFSFLAIPARLIGKIAGF